MNSRFLFLLSFLIPTITFISIYNYSSFSWACVFFAFVLLPLLEFVFESKSSAVEFSDSLFFDLILYIHVPIQFSLLFYFLHITTTVNLSSLQSIGLILCMGINCGVIGINIAHELGHRKSKFEVFLAKSLLVSSLYYQFYIDHNKGHHKYVSTPEDPASARLNENLYSFLIRSTLGTYVSAFKIDKKEMLTGILIEALFLVLIGVIFGGEGVVYFVAAAFIGGILLECVNYIEHYGLERKINPSGRYEKITPKHSWNSNHLFGRGILFNLSRHSDHHYLSTKKYQKLENHGDSPNLPTGYPGMILLSTIPPLWFRVMNPRV